MKARDLIRILKQGVDVWNAWREEHPRVRPYLYRADLEGADLARANLRNARLSGANLSHADLRHADLRFAKLTATQLRNANLRGACLAEAKLNEADLSGADLSHADLRRARLVQTDLRNAVLDSCQIYGISAWGLELDGAEQSNLIITDKGEPVVTVDDIEVAQFVYLLLRNPRLRQVIHPVGEKAVLILGRCTAQRKLVLAAVRAELRRLGYVPIMFDFERPTNRDFTETIMMLAGMCLFVIADITKPRSSPLELQATVPDYMIPFVPIIQEGEEPFAMFKDLKVKYDWVLDPLVYDSASNLVRGLKKAVIGPALRKHDELMVRKTEQLRKRHIADYL